MARKEDMTGNPLKTGGRSKASTRAAADKARPSEERTPVDRTVTGQGGSKKGGGEADTRHPTQRGGVTPEMDEGVRDDL